MISTFSITSAFWTIPESLSAWDFANSPIVVTLILGPVALCIVSILTGKDKTITALRETLQAFKDTIDDQHGIDEELPDVLDSVVSRNESPESAVDNREAAKKIARDAKDFIEEKMEEDSDGRHRRTYDNISGHYPIARVKALEERRQVKEDQSRALIVLLSAWQRYSKGKGAAKPVPSAIVELMRREWKKVNG